MKKTDQRGFNLAYNLKIINTIIILTSLGLHSPSARAAQQLAVSAPNANIYESADESSKVLAVAPRGLSLKTSSAAFQGFYKVLLSALANTVEVNPGSDGTQKKFGWVRESDLGDASTTETIASANVQKEAPWLKSQHRRLIVRPLFGLGLSSPSDLQAVAGVTPGMQLVLEPGMYIGYKLAPRWAFGVDARYSIFSQDTLQATSLIFMAQGTFVIVNKMPFRLEVDLGFGLQQVLGLDFNYSGIAVNTVTFTSYSIGAMLRANYSINNWFSLGAGVGYRMNMAPTLGGQIAEKPSAAFNAIQSMIYGQFEF